MSLTTYSSAPDIVADYEAWIEWMEARIADFEENCPLERGLTYYFSQSSGNDTTGDGSIGNPWKTRNKAKEIQAYHGSSIRLRFKCGDTWTEPDNWVITDNDVTIDSYSTGNKPFFNAFEEVLSGDIWVDEGGGTWSTSAAGDVAYIRLVNDRLGSVRGTQFIRLNSAAATLSVPNSFYYDSGTTLLYVNLNGDNPNSSADDLPIEVVYSNLNNGVEFQGDGCRCEGIRADGYGIHRTSVATQDQPFTNRNSGDSANLFKNCEGYFSNTHVMAHNKTGTGGRSMFLNCIAGLGQVDPGSDAMSCYNSYTSSGGHETWCLDCECKGGALPEYTWPYDTEKVAGTGFLCHSGGTAADLYVCYNMTLSILGTSKAMYFSDLNDPATMTQDVYTSCRAFTVGCQDTVYPSAHADNVCDRSPHTIFYGNRWYMRPVSGGVAGWRNSRMVTNEYFFNNEFVADMTNYGSGVFSFYNGTTGTSVGTLVNNAFIFKNWVVTSANVRFGFNYDNRSNTGAPGSGNVLDRFFNNILSINTSGSAPFSLALNNSSTYLKCNALYDIDENTGEDRGTNNMLNKVELSSPYNTAGADVLLLRRAGTPDIFLSHDINGKARNVAKPDIGPVDFSSWGFDYGSGGKQLSGVATVSLADAQVSVRNSQASAIFGKILHD